jgi:hypothetical protein
MPFYEADFVAAFPGQVFPQFQYCNVSGLMSNMAAHQLVAMCMKNGSTASVAQYGGLAGTGRMMNGGAPVGMGGSVIVLRPGIDFNLPMGVVTGTMGNIQLQYTISYINQSRRAAQFVINTTAVAAGYCVIDNGAGRVLNVGLNPKGVSMADLTWDKTVTSKIERGGFLGTLAAVGTSMLGRAALHAGKRIIKGAVNGIFGDDESGGATAGAGMRQPQGAGQKRSRGSLFAALAGNDGQY